LGQELAGVELWGKTLAARPPATAPETFDVWFTSIPDEVRAMLAKNTRD